MNGKAFDASRYLRKLNGRDYLEVKWRLLWLRNEHPDAVISTDLFKHEEGLAIFRANVSLPGGARATGWGSETAGDFGDYIEKAETKALGRALAALGFGTQFCEDFDFSDGNDAAVVDAPVSLRFRSVADGGSRATGPQVQAIYSIGRQSLDMSEDEVEAMCRERFGRGPAELERREASQFIDALKERRGRAPDARVTASAAGG